MPLKSPRHIAATPSLTAGYRHTRLQWGIQLRQKALVPVQHSGPDIEGCLHCCRPKYTAAVGHLTSKGLPPLCLETDWNATHRHLTRDWSAAWPCNTRTPQERLKCSMALHHTDTSRGTEVQHGPAARDSLRCCRLRRTGWRLWSTWRARVAT